MMTAQGVKEALDALAMLNFFSADPGTRSQIGELLTHICANDVQAQKLTERTSKIYNNWPGPLALRAVASSMFTPADGQEAVSPEVDSFVETRRQEIETERTRLQLESAKQKLIASGQPLPAAIQPGQISADPEAEKTVKQIAAAQESKIHGLSRRGQKRLETLEAFAEKRPPQTITQKDIEQAVAELHRKQAEPPEAA